MTLELELTFQNLEFKIFEVKIINSKFWKAKERDLGRRNTSRQKVRLPVSKALVTLMRNVYQQHLITVNTGIQAALADKPHPEFSNLDFGKKKFERN